MKCLIIYRAINYDTSGKKNHYILKKNTVLELEKLILLLIIIIQNSKSMKIRPKSHDSKSWTMASCYDSVAADSCHQSSFAFATDGIPLEIMFVL